MFPCRREAIPFCRCFRFLLPLGSGFAGREAPPAPTRFREASANPFAKGSLSIENVTGLYYFFDRGDNDGATLDFAVNSLRLGVVLSDPHGIGFFAGNSEFLAEVFGGGIFQGAGNVLAGGTLIIRYNFSGPARGSFPTSRSAVAEFTRIYRRRVPRD